VAERGTGLPEMVDALRWRWYLVLLVAVPVVVGAALYAESLDPLYDASAIVAISPRPESGQVSADLIRIEAPKYVSYITAPSTLRRLAPRLDEEPVDLTDGVSADVQTDTGNITISVRLPTARRASATANVLAADVVRFSGSDPLLAAQLVAPAAPPRSPAWPPRRLIEAAALLVGLVLGAAVAFLVERGRPRIRTWRDIASITGYPVLGRIPASASLRGRRAHPLDPALGVAIRTLRVNLERAADGEPKGVVMVTSSSDGEGKTTIARMLAESFARVGLRVLLVDADLHRATLSRSLDFGPRSGGLADILRGRLDLNDTIATTVTEGLYVLPTTTDPDAGDELARRFPELAETARQTFDLIVLDSPPLLGTADARTLAALADGVVVVASAGRMATPLAEATQALETLRVKVLGAVGNRLRRSGGTSYYAYLSPG
jgi:polysaccharide biosynthesis transport protein